MSSDHPVFKRFSRQQLIVRRRSIGFQTLVFETTQPKTPRCKHCGRYFNAVWKEFLCHVCGLWVCQTCSSVIERERELNRIQYVRSCCDCLSKLNKWSDPELIDQFAVAPWVVQSSKSQLSLTLSDALRTKKEARHAVLVVLKHLGMSVDAFVGLIDQISDDDWVGAATNDVSSPLLHQASGVLDIHGKSDEPLSTIESAQHLVQQCFDLVVPELPLEECVFAEANGTRTYPIFYDVDDEESIILPAISGEEERELCMDRYNLLSEGHQFDDEMQLICDLAARELDATSAFVSVVRNDQQHAISCRTGCARSKLRRSETFCAFALTSSLPFLVRDAALDIRFRNFDVVRGSSHVLFYFGFPILTREGTYVASLCVVDTKPRKYVTTMQYTIMKKLANIISCLWEEAVMVAQI